MRIVRVLLRRKSRVPSSRQSVKIVTNCRVPERKKPIQIHLGYLSLRFEGGIPQGQRSKLLRNLRRKWMFYFQSEDVDVDWADAESKLRLLQAPPSDASDLIESTASPPREVECYADSSHGPLHRPSPSASPGVPAAPADHEQRDAGI